MNDLEIRQAVDALVKEIKPPYLHGMKEFVPGKTLVPYSGPMWDHEEIAGAMKTFLTGSWLTTGTEVFKFQNQFAKKFNVGYAHMVNSGSSANLVLITAMKKRFGWKDGDEIIVSPVGFPTTIAPIAQNNLKPVFVDIEMDTLNFDVNKIQDVITDRTVAIFVSPVLGNPPDLDKLTELCEDNRLLLIGDNCDSLGSKWDANHITDYYSAWTTSFYPAHHITTAEGGMVCSYDEELIKLCRSISWWGRACYCVGAANLLACGTCGNRFAKHLQAEGIDDVIDHKYVFENMGYNLKPLDLQGSIGLAQLRKFDMIHANRVKNFEIIKTWINEIPGVRVASNLEKTEPSWFGVPIICDTASKKEHLVRWFEKNKIQTRSYFAGNILTHPGYKHLGKAADFPNAQLALSHVFFLGCPPFYTSDVLTYIYTVIQDFKLLESL